jgi:hypothetical protein
MTVFDLAVEQVQGSHPRPRHRDETSRDDHIETQFTASLPRTSCSFERIYFSRGNDFDIYRERKALGGTSGRSGDRIDPSATGVTPFSVLFPTPRKSPTTA